MTEEAERGFKTGAEILATPDFRDDVVWVDEWQTNVRCRSLTVAQRQKIEMTAQQKGITSAAIKAEVVLMGAMNEDGKPMFTKEDKQAMMTRNAVPVEALFRAIFKVSKMPVPGEPAATVDDIESD